MKFIDTHCHLFLSREAYAKWDYSVPAPDTVLNRAQKAGVEKLILIGTDLIDSQKNIEFCKNHHGAYCAVGIHPSEIPENQEKQKYILDELKKMLENKNVVAIGEIGLDLSYGGDIKIQKDFLIKLIELAKKYDKPIILHIRDEYEKAQSLLKSYRGKVRMVFHCFTGDLKIAEKLIADGWMISFTNIISYPKNEKLREVVQKIPLKKIMIETDAPFLPPQSRRGTICEPADVVEVAQEIAKIKNIELSEVDKATYSNSQVFFNL